MVCLICISDALSALERTWGKKSVNEVNRVCFIYLLLRRSFLRFFEEKRTAV